MARLAWFTPLPPVRSGIAAYNAELLPFLAAHHEIDVFTSPAPPQGRTWDPASAGLAWDPGPGLSTGTGTVDSHWNRRPGLPAGTGVSPAGVRTFSAHDFPWKHDRTPYDLVVYQLGNAACHDFMWPHLARYPGLVVLHDGQLHHERSRALLSRGRVDDYRAEFRYNHPDAPEHIPDLVVSTLAGSLYYLYPMLRWVLQTARLVAVHSAGLAAELKAAYPGVEVQRVRHGMLDPATDPAKATAAMVRSRHDIPAGGLLFAAFGLVTPEKRISAVLRALARLDRERAASPPDTGVRGENAPPRDLYLLLAGSPASYYDAAAEAQALGIADRVRIAGYIADDDLPAYVLAADVCLCLRWPTSGETSGTWIRAIAAGKPTIVTRLAHNSEVPMAGALDVMAGTEAGPTTRSGNAMAGTEAGPTARIGASEAKRKLRPTPDSVSTELNLNVAGPTTRTPVTIAIDVLNEEEDLRAAMARLAGDARLREDLGRAAREYWAANHTMACAREDYLRVIERAMARPVPRVRNLPAHLMADHTALAREITGDLGVETDVSRPEDAADDAAVVTRLDLPRAGG